MPNKVHEGKNIKRFREMLGMKQDALAFELGDDWNQKKVSLLEGKETVEQEILEQVAKILKVSPEAIKNFNEEAAINIISNTFSHNQQAGAYIVNNNPTFNPIDKIVQLYDEKIELYERMLASEKEKNELLQGKQPKK
ncbi:helix-turn-helix transcriptional regulator [Chitinophaga arvensicola]|uniref:Helix-turn-helix domain-containing protein n=1 Tax=Chitinophaga arvensicola TaxID=29529 RepID=A0A1I0S7S3_9BACT|nr:helix-turn-helix transcriptional regulator [Chitinophaga arvensicola]SEW51882.1 Helix-turn-helix domain-containing protein [Chitinophaga arvensicola]